MAGKPLVSWLVISAHLTVHRDTAVEWYKHEGLPVTIIKGKAVSTEEAIQQWINKRIEKDKSANNRTKTAKDRIPK